MLFAHHDCPFVRFTSRYNTHVVAGLSRLSACPFISVEHLVVLFCRRYDAGDNSWRIEPVNTFSFDRIELRQDHLEVDAVHFFKFDGLMRLVLFAQQVVKLRKYVRLIRPDISIPCKPLHWTGTCMGSQSPCEWSDLISLAVATIRSLTITSLGKGFSPHTHTHA